MFYPDTFQIATPTDREIEIVRDFAAPRQLVFDAFTQPELVRRWLLGPPGWTMPVCEIDLRVGGAYRYVWHKDGVPDMGMGGHFRQVESPVIIVATEKFDDSWYPGEALTTTTFTESNGVTKTTITVLYESKQARDTARASGMEHGMAAGYNRLEQLLSDTLATPQIIQIPAQLAAIIHLTIPRNQIQSVMGPGIGEIMTAIKSQSIVKTGPWFTHHRTMQPGSFDFEICVPIATPIVAVGRVVSQQFPALKAARTFHNGSYEGLAAAWGDFGQWLNANGLTPAPDLYECYLTGPDSAPNPAAWRTQLTRPLLDQ